MLDAGEDPKFIARRMVIFASEDIGNVDPLALVVATSVAQAVQFVGLPRRRSIWLKAPHTWHHDSKTMRPTSVYWKRSRMPKPTAIWGSRSISGTR